MGFAIANQTTRIYPNINLGIYKTLQPAPPYERRVAVSHQLFLSLSPDLQAAEMNTILQKITQYLEKYTIIWIHVPILGLKRISAIVRHPMSDVEKKSMDITIKTRKQKHLINR